MRGLRSHNVTRSVVAAVFIAALGLAAGIGCQKDVIRDTRTWGSGEIERAERSRSGSSKDRDAGFDLWEFLFGWMDGSEEQRPDLGARDLHNVESDPVEAKGWSGFWNKQDRPHDRP